MTVQDRFRGTQPQAIGNHPTIEWRRPTRTELLVALVSIAGPLVVLGLLGNRNWLFDGHGSDTWVFSSYFHDYSKPGPFRDVLDHDYKGGRLPWIIPGHVSYALFGAETGNILLQIGVLVAAGLASYLSLTIAFNTTTAALVTPWFVSFPGLHASGYVNSWSYNGHAGVVYFLFTHLFLVVALGTGRRWWLAVAGVFGAFSIHTSMQYGAFVPILAVYYFAFAPLRDWKQILSDLGRTAAGFSAASFGLAAINAATGGTLWFFRVQYEYSRDSVASGRVFTLWESWADWIHRATWWSLPAALVASIPLLWLLPAFRRSASVLANRRIVAITHVQLLLAIAVLLYFDVVKHMPVANVPYTAMMYLPQGVVALGAILFGTMPVLPPRRNLLVALAAILVFAATQVALTTADRQVWLHQLRVFFPAPTWPWAVTAAIAVIGVALLPWLNRRAWTIPVALFALFPLTVLNYSGDRVAAGTRCGYDRDAFNAINEARTFVMDAGLLPANGAYWFRPGTVLDREGDCPPVDLGSVFLRFVYSAFLNEAVGTLRSPEPAELDRRYFERTRFIVLSAPADGEADAEKIFARGEALGTPVSRIATREFQCGPVQFIVQIVTPIASL